MTKQRQFTKLFFAAALTLIIGGCGEKDDKATGAVSGAPVAAVPAPAGTTWEETVAVSEYDGYVLGNPDAPIKLVEYASLTCPACAAFSAEATEPLLSKYVASGRVSYELRNLVIHGAPDLALTTLVRCGAKESFHPLSEQIWLNMQDILAPIYANSGAVEQAIALPANERLVKIAEIGKFYDFFAARGISADQAKTCLADEAKYTKIADNSRKQGEDFEVGRTPTFFINGKKYEGNSWRAIEAELQAAGAR